MNFTTTGTKNAQIETLGSTDTTRSIVPIVGLSYSKLCSVLAESSGD